MVYTRNIGIKSELTKKVKKSNPNKKVKIPLSSFVLSESQLNINNYYKESDLKEGWVYSRQMKSKINSNYNIREIGDSADFNEILAVDCEMCKTDFCDRELTRISIINKKKEVLLDKYVLPENKIVDYLTEFSGITADTLKGVTTRLSDIHKILDELVGPETILMGHSLERDFMAMKFIHRKVIDTSVMYLGYNGKKISLKNLASKHLERTIQNSKGHNSIEDAETVLDLVKLKIKGKNNINN